MWCLLKLKREIDVWQFQGKKQWSNNIVIRGIILWAKCSVCMCCMYKNIVNIITNAKSFPMPKGWLPKILWNHKRSIYSHSLTMLCLAYGLWELTAIKWWTISLYAYVYSRCYWMRKIARVQSKKEEKVKWERKSELQIVRTSDQNVYSF